MVIDPDGQPRGTAVAEQAGRFEIMFDPAGLPAAGAVLRLVAVSDSGGRSEATVRVRHGAEGLAVLEDELLDATMLSDGRVLVASTRGLLLQTSEGSAQFLGPLDSTGAARQVVAPGPDGDAFAAGGDDVVLHYDAQGELCESIRLLATQTEGGDAHPTRIDDLATQFGAGSTEVTAAHDLGFSGFDFTGRPCADDCADFEECTIDPTSGFSTGTCLTSDASPDFRATAIAMDADRAYTGGYTFNVRSLSAGTNVCVDLQLQTESPGPIEDIAVSQDSVWVAIARGVSRMERAFPVGSGVARPEVDRFGEGRPVADGLDALPDSEILNLAAASPGNTAVDGVWFGTPSGFGLLVRSDAGDETAWISGLSLPGRSVRAIVAPVEEPGLLWVATDGGLARLRLPTAP